MNKLDNPPGKVYERDIEKYLVDCVGTAGGEIRKVKWIGRRGAPDRRIMLGGGAWVELKAPGVRLKPHQLREHTRMMNAGETVVTVASFYGASMVVRILKHGGKLSSGRYE